MELFIFRIRFTGLVDIVSLGIRLLSGLYSVLQGYDSYIVISLAPIVVYTVQRQTFPYLHRVPYLPIFTRIGYLSSWRCSLRLTFTVLALPSSKVTRDQ